MNWLAKLFHEHEWDRSRNTFEHVTLASGEVDHSKKNLRTPCRTCGVIGNHLFIAGGPNVWVPVGNPWFEQPSRNEA